MVAYILNKNIEQKKQKEQNYKYFAKGMHV